MRIRGSRACQDCGTHWSYYETGEISCPSCGSLRSVGVDDRSEHTDGPVTLDLTPSRSMVESDGLLTALEDAAERAREFVRRSGFINAGELKPLSDEYLSSTELSYVAREYARVLDPSLSETEEIYLLMLLRGTDVGDRPSPRDVPDSARVARNLAYTTALSEYRGDVRTYLDQHPAPEAARVMASVGDHARRIEALDGDVRARTTETLVETVRDVADYLTDGEESALATAQSRLDRLVDT